MGTITEQLTDARERVSKMEIELAELQDHCEKLKTACSAKDKKIYALIQRAMNADAAKSDLESKLLARDAHIERLLDHMDVFENLTAPEASEAPEAVAEFLALLRDSLKRDGDDAGVFMVKILMNHIRD